MISQIPSSFMIATTVVVLTSVVTMMLRKSTSSKANQSPGNASYPLASTLPDHLPQYIQNLLSDLDSGCVILQSDTTAFQLAVDGSWAQQNREIIPACIVRPRNAEQLAKAVIVFEKEFSRRREQHDEPSPTHGFFAVRSGGLNPGLGAATVEGGVMIDLSLINEVTLSEDRSTVTVGAGVKWIEVYKVLEEKGLVVMGGRSSPAGVGGLALQGGLSFYTPKYGFVCSNVERYEVVLANGNVVMASASENQDLWRALKGGGNNFGIVTRFTFLSLPLAPLWFGQMFALAAFQQAKAINAYHDYLKNASSGQPGAFDENAAGPILSFVQIRGIPLHVIALQLVYTKAPANQQWPDHWKKTKFTSLWFFRRNCSVRSHISAVEQNGSTAPPGTRHMQGTTTIRNDVGTMQAAYEIFCQTTREMCHVQGLLFPFTFQAILPGWVNKGHPNVLGLENCTEPLIIIGCSVTWAEAKDDEFVRTTICRMLGQIDAAAAVRQTGHPYRFMNYCMEFQRPYDGCGDETKNILKDARLKYDPDGLFQNGCAGGFKLS